MVDLKNYNFPPLPWTHEALGEEAYCKLAVDLGFFNPRAEATTYRPSLDPTAFLDHINKPAPAARRKADTDQE